MPDSVKILVCFLVRSVTGESFFQGLPLGSFWAAKRSSVRRSMYSPMDARAGRGLAIRPARRASSLRTG